ncbi:hypothetical protein [Microbacterium sp.]|uniref:hypothetical protein n=1 Tax=Microbacterium sp. TaxID=51671 RepID=UPI002FE02F03
MWTLELFRTVDGLRYGELPAAGFSWSRELRKGSLDAPPQGLGTERASGLEWSVASLEAAGWIDRNESGWQERLVALFMPKKHGVIALYDGIPIAGGPIADTVSFEADTVAITVDDYAAGILSRRFVVPETFSPKKQVKVTGKSIGGLAVEALRVAMRKPAGGLPFELPASETGTQTAEWKGYAVAQLAAEDVITDFADLGPDIDFRPKVLDEQHFVWEVVHGSADQLELGQTTVHDWEQGSPDVVSITSTLSTAYIAHRVYAVGGGQDVATPIQRRDAEVPEGWPLIEQVISDSTISAVPEQEVWKKTAAEATAAYDAAYQDAIAKSDAADTKAAQAEAAVAAAKKALADAKTAAQKKAAKAKKAAADKVAKAARAAKTAAQKAETAKKKRLDDKLKAAEKAAEKTATDQQRIWAKEQLQRLGDANLTPYPMLQIEMTIRADGITPLGTFWPGEVAHVTTHDHPALPDGTYPLRILSMSGDAGESVTLVFDPIQPERY